MKSKEYFNIVYNGVQMNIKVKWKQPYSSITKDGIREALKNIDASFVENIGYVGNGWYKLPNDVLCGKEMWEQFNRMLANSYSPI